MIVGACAANLPEVVPWLSMMSIPFNSLLFVIRTSAVFHDSRLIQSFFVLLWLGVVAGAFTQPFCVTFVALDIVRSCTPSIVRRYCTSSSVIVMVHDTLVLFAISAKLSLYHLAEVDTWSEKAKTFFGARGMPQLSKLLMQTGQLYYL